MQRIVKQSQSISSIDRRVQCRAKTVTLLDYGAGNVRSVKNAIKKCGYNIKEVHSAADIQSADKLIFPGVGSIGHAMDALNSLGLKQALIDYLQEGRPYFGICLGLQLLLDGSEEDNCEGLGIIPGKVTRFPNHDQYPVPHIGWNNVRLEKDVPALSHIKDQRVYFVHSYRFADVDATSGWVGGTTDYNGRYTSAVYRGDVLATQFHPEKSGNVGIQVYRSFLEGRADDTQDHQSIKHIDGLSKRVIACLDVRANDSGDLVVTKGDSYDVRDKDDGGQVRNLGKPVTLAANYFDQGADEITFLNITGFRDFPLDDLPMLEVVKRTSEQVFVPLTVGGGIRGFKDSEGTEYSALQVADQYFRSGADKISIGSDAVLTVQAWLDADKTATGTSSIEVISKKYGAQAVVVSIDPRKVYVQDPSDTHHTCMKLDKAGPGGEEWCWWQCTVSGGREGSDVDAVQLAQGVEALGAGEILLNCIDNDGQGEGFDCGLVEQVSSAVSIPVIASSGAGSPQHFSEVFKNTSASAALAAGIFHRGEVTIREVKDCMLNDDIPTRL